jgi:ectoine hydroxylase-related dioxygenase (phytanoyl-CoA dioxygenase family)
VENGCLEMARVPRVTRLLGPEWSPLGPEQISALDMASMPTTPGDVPFFDSYAPHASQPNLTAAQRRMLYLTYNCTRAGDHRRRYYDDKRTSFPPDIDRLPGREYRFRV